MALVSAYSFFGCFAVLVGKRASEDGSVLVGHNEQDSGRRILNFRVIPRIKHKSTDIVKLVRGGSLPEVEETYSFIWSENPGLEFSDMYINEWGVTVASDGCATREDSYEKLVAKGDIVDGGIGYMLRRLIVQRSKSAKEGILIAGELLNHFGYSDSGRTLVVADPNEIWLLSIIRGKHWLAKRVPDDEVAILPNVHIITNVNLEDTDNYIGSPDIIDYAIKRGWHDPSKPFSFRDAYNPPTNDFWDPRQWRGQSLITEKVKEFPITEQLPFSVKPDKKLNVADVIKILRYHGIKGSLCSPPTLEGAVFQLRNWLPQEIGCIYWRASAETCTSVLIPWYLGITKVPESYHKPVSIEKQLTVEHHINPPEGTFDPDPNHTWWKFKRMQDLVNSNYEVFIKKVRKVWDEFERKLYYDQPFVEANALKMFSGSKDEARKYLTNYSKDISDKAISIAESLESELKKG